jgi:DNA (cytosine-5)-methyltransferase 1
MSFIEVCAGAGGLSSGFIKAGLRPLLLVDNDKWCCETLKKNHEPSVVRCESMTDTDLTPYQGRVDVLCGGIPCQSWSLSGQRGGFEDPRGSLVYRFKELLLQCRPKCFLIENVKGMVNHNGGKSLKEILNLLSCDGTYDIVYKVLNANDYGVAQNRHRLIIVGTSRGQPAFEFPEPVEPKLVLRDVLSNVPESPGVKYPENKKKVLDMVPEGGCWVDLPEDVQREYMGKSIHSGGGKRGVAKRLSMSKPSTTLTCSPSQKQTEKCHPLETRPLTTREYARIQSFPDDYGFSGSVSNVYKQIGNAVPVNFAYHVGVSLKRCTL